jgi:intracellular septation protein
MDSARTRLDNPVMKWLFDLFPVILFFAAYKLAGIYTATAVAIGATVVQVGWLWWRGRKVEPALWLSFVVVVVFGGATLALHDEAFIKWKPTVLYLLFTAGLLIAQHGYGKSPMRALMGGQISLPEPAWKRLNAAWAGFFALLAVLNIVVAQHFSTDAWVNFKLFGVTGLMLVFVFAQALVLSRYADEPAAVSDAPKQDAT